MKVKYLFLLCLLVSLPFLWAGNGVAQETDEEVVILNQIFLTQRRVDVVEIQKLLEERNSPLANYETLVLGQKNTGAEILVVASVHENWSINPELLLTYLEWQYQLLSSSNLTSEEIDAVVNITGEADPNLVAQLTWLSERFWVEFEPHQDKPTAATRAVETVLVDVLGGTVILDEFVKVYTELFGHNLRSRGRMPRTNWQPYFRKPFNGFYAINSFFDHGNRGDGKILRFDDRILPASGAGYGWYDGHKAIDYNTGYNPVVAAGSGTIAFAGSATECGKISTFVIINHPNGFQTKYWHLSSINGWKSGDTINAGDTIGNSGNTGCSQGAHLHFAIKETATGKAIDPYGFWGNNKQQPLFKSSTMIEEGSDGFERFYHNRWQVADGNNGNSFYTLTGSGTDYKNWVMWWADISTSGEYQIKTFIPSEAEATDVTYKIMHADGVSHVTRNQADNRGKWMSLGHYSFKAHQLAAVILTDRTTGETNKKQFFDTMSWVNSSFNEVTGIPEQHLDTTWWFPWHDSMDYTTWIVVGNPNPTDVEVEIDIAGQKMTGIVKAEGVWTPRYDNIKKGPVKVMSTDGQPIYASLRTVVGNTAVQQRQQTPQLSNTSARQVFDSPIATDTTSRWYFPWYDDDDVGNTSNWILVGNPNEYPVTVKITIGDKVEDTHTIPEKGVWHHRYPDTMGGPVEVVSANQEPIFVTQRAVRNDSFNEVMGTPDKLLDTVWWLPWYDNILSADSWIMIGNPNNTPTTVDIYIGGDITETNEIPANGVWHPIFDDTMDGPVKVVSSQKVFVTKRTLWNEGKSFDETRAIPQSLLDKRWWFPWYHSDDEHTNWILIGNPNDTATTVEISIAGETKGTYTILPNEVVSQVYDGIDGIGPVEVFSRDKKPIFVTQRVLWNGNDFNETVGVPSSLLKHDVSNSGCVKGTVTDAKSGKPLSNVVVTLYDLDSGITYTRSTSKHGKFVFSKLPASDYQFKARATGEYSIHTEFVSSLHLDENCSYMHVELTPPDSDTQKRVKDYAPIIYQDTDNSNAEADYITRFDYDDDWGGINNWENLEDFDLNAYVYSKASKTDSHYFLEYYLYHPRDWGESETGAAWECPETNVDESPYPWSVRNRTCHEHDLEGVVIAIDRGNDEIAGWAVQNHSDAEGCSARKDRDNVEIFSQAKGHALECQEKDFPGDDGVIYKYTGKAEIPEDGNDRDVGYDLLSVDHDLRVIVATHAGRAAFTDEGDHFLGDTYGDNKATTPWVLAPGLIDEALLGRDYEEIIEDIIDGIEEIADEIADEINESPGFSPIIPPVYRNGRQTAQTYNYAGDMFVDPARLLKTLIPTLTISTDYEYNPYIQSTAPYSPNQTLIVSTPLGESSLKLSRNVVDSEATVSVTYQMPDYLPVNAISGTQPVYLIERPFEFSLELADATNVNTLDQSVEIISTISKQTLAERNVDLSTLVLMQFSNDVWQPLPVTVDDSGELGVISTAVNTTGIYGLFAAKISPVAKFTPIITGTEKTTAWMIDESVGEIKEWYWEFGDGMTSTLQYPTHTYEQTGTYTVSLSVKAINGQDMVTRAISVGELSSSTLVLIQKTKSENHTFQYTHNASNTFSLFTGQPYTLTNTMPGIHTISVEPTSYPDEYWQLVAVQCYDRTRMVYQIDHDNYSVDISVEPGEHLTCELVSERAGYGNFKQHLPLIIGE